MKNMQASILLIGNELLNGIQIDTNGFFLASEITKLNIQVGQICVVPDNSGSIEVEIKRLAEQSELLLLSGGLGPTEDDKTREAVAKTCKVNLEINLTAQEKLKTFVEGRGRTVNKNNLRQVYFPQGAEVISNPVGTADAFLSSYQKISGGVCRIIALPGVPRELETIFSQFLIPKIQEHFPNALATVSHSLKFFGVAESHIGSVIEGCNLSNEVQVAYRPCWPEIIVTFSVFPDKILSSAQAKALVQSSIKTVITAIGEEYIFAKSINETIASCVGDLLRRQSKTIAIAESCSGGIIADMLVSVPGASDYFLASVVTYSNAAKKQLLSIEPDLIKKFGAVSKEVALSMAQEVKLKTNSSIGLSVTGIAGPGGATEDKPVGTAWFGLVVEDGPGEVFLLKHTTERNLFRQYCGFYALDLVRRKLLGLPLTWKRI